jgi:Holliday junction DNA helicase RuvA
MISYLDGVLAEKQPTSVVLDVNGIGYEVLIPLSTYDRLPRRNERCRLLVFEHLRDDAHQLFGFVTEDERETFNLLVGVSGIGPKIALRALSGLSVRELRAAVVQGDIKRLSSISGIGRKTAERMVVELKDRIGAAAAAEAVASVRAGGGADTRLRDAVLALIALGYQQAAAKKMVTEALDQGGEPLTVEAVVKRALQE